MLEYLKFRDYIISIRSVSLEVLRLIPTESSEDLKLVVVTPLSNARHIKGSSTQNWLTRCQTNVTGQAIIRLCLRCDISVRPHYKVVIIPSVTSRHHPAWNVLKGTLNPIQKYQWYTIFFHFVLYEWLNIILDNPL